MEFRLDDGQVELQQTVGPVLRRPLPPRRGRRPGGRGRPTVPAGPSMAGARRVRRCCCPRPRAAAASGSSRARSLFEQLGRAPRARPGAVDGARRAARRRRRHRRHGSSAGSTSPRSTTARPLVEHAADLDVLLVVDDDGVAAHRTADLAPPTPLDPLDPLTPVGRFTGLAGGRPVRRRRGRGRGCACSARSSARRCSSASRRARSTSPATTPSSASSSACRSGRSRRSSTCSPTCTCAAAWPRAPPTRPPRWLQRPRRRRRRSARPRPPSCSPPRPPSPTRARPSRCSAAWASPGTCCPNHLLKRAWVLEQAFGAADDHALHLGSTLAGGVAVTGEDRTEGVVVDGRRRRAAHRHRPPGRARARSTRRPSAASSRRSRRPRPTTRCGWCCSPARGDDFCSRRRLGGQQRGRRAEAPPRQPPAPHRAAGPPPRSPCCWRSSCPVVCAVRGWAAGLGCQLALAADFTVAADDSRFWLPFTTRGFTPDSGATWLSPGSSASPAPRRCCCSAGRSAGRDAAAWGMIHRAVPADEPRRRRRRAGGRAARQRHRRHRPHQAVPPLRARRRHRRRHGRRGAGAGAVVAHGRLPRGPRRLHGAPPTRFEGR